MLLSNVFFFLGGYIGFIHTSDKITLLSLLEARFPVFPSPSASHSLCPSLYRVQCIFGCFFSSFTLIASKRTVRDSSVNSRLQFGLVLQLSPRLTCWLREALCNPCAPAAHFLYIWKSSWLIFRALLLHLLSLFLN